MASYFDEHNCEPLRDSEQPDHLLQLARYSLKVNKYLIFMYHFIFSNPKSNAMFRPHSTGI